MRAWLRPLVVGMSLFIGICGGSWGTMHWLSRSRPAFTMDGRPYMKLSRE